MFACTFRPSEKVASTPEENVNAFSFRNRLKMQNESLMSLDGMEMRFQLTFPSEVSVTTGTEETI